jgi:hypothetical protein
MCLDAEKIPINLIRIMPAEENVNVGIIIGS